MNGRASTFNGLSGTCISRRVKVITYLLNHDGRARFVDIARETGLDKKQLRLQAHALEHSELAEGIREHAHSRVLVLRRPALGTLGGEHKLLFDAIWQAWLAGDMETAVSNRALERLLGWPSASVTRITHDLMRMGWCEGRLEGPVLEAIVPTLAAIVLRGAKHPLASPSSEMHLATQTAA